MSDDAKISATELARRLQARYPSSSHCTMLEVRNAAGFDASRSADCVSISTWPSHGLLLRGFEIKTSRQDWLREMEQPLKADAFFLYCDEWYLVTPDKRVADPDELPQTWGHMVASGQSLRVVKPAVVNGSPKPLPRSMLAAFLKRAMDQGNDAKIREAVNRSKSDWEDVGYRRAKEELGPAASIQGKDLLERFNQMSQRTSWLERELGLDPGHISGTWTPIEHIRDVVKPLLSNSLHFQRNAARRLVHEIDLIRDRLLGFAETPAWDNLERAALARASSTNDDPPVDSTEGSLDTELAPTGD